VIGRVTLEELVEKMKLERELRDKVGIIDLPCYKLSIYPAGESWNGYVRYWRDARVDPVISDEVDRWLPSGAGISYGDFYIARNDPDSFEAGSYWYGIEHLYYCDSCRLYNRYTTMAVYKKLYQIIRSWEDRMR
jgi:hypothetical protein